MNEETGESEREREKNGGRTYPIRSRGIGLLHGRPEVVEDFVASVVGARDMDASLKPGGKLHRGASDVQHHSGDINEGRKEDNSTRAS
jgi:hypothetical protein